MSITIRQLEMTDYEKYKIMINEFRETDFTYEEFSNTLNYISTHSEIWVIENNSDIIATGTIIYEQKFIFNNCKFAHIEDICVKQSYRKLGFGKLIINHLLIQAKLHKCYKVTLVCNEYNIQFYEKCGLEKRGFQLSQLISNL
jgi:glucosamine-phosphate N-acetyltransferase